MLMVIDIFLFTLTHILLILFSPGSAKADNGEVEYWADIWWPVVPEVFVPDIIKTGYPFFKRHVQDVFVRTW